MRLDFDIAMVVVELFGQSLTLEDPGDCIDNNKHNPPSNAFLVRIVFSHILSS